MKQKKQKTARKKHLFSIRFYLILYVFLLMLSSAVVVGSVMNLIYKASLPEFIKQAPPSMVILSALLASTVLGTVLSLTMSKLLMRSVRRLIDGIEAVSEGNYSVKIPVGNERAELGQLIRSFNRMTEELSGVELFRNDFVNNFSHEFKTPIVSIRGFARQLAEDPDCAERQEYARIIVSECDRLVALSSSILLLTRFENQKIVTDKTTFDLAEQIRRCILLLEKQWSAKGISFDLELPELPYTTNEEMLSQVWLNLLTNAIRFCPDTGGRILVLLETYEQGIRCTVSDNGPGMDDHTLSHIFEKFYQGDTSHRTEGNGLGLPLVKRILELCGGSIAAHSSADAGAIFTVCLPGAGD